MWDTSCELRSWLGDHFWSSLVFLSHKNNRSESWQGVRSGFVLWCANFVVWIPWSNALLVPIWPTLKKRNHNIFHEQCLYWVGENTFTQTYSVSSLKFSYLKSSNSFRSTVHKKDQLLLLFLVSISPLLVVSKTDFTFVRFLRTGHQQNNNLDSVDDLQGFPVYLLWKLN